MENFSEYNAYREEVDCLFEIINFEKEIFEVKSTHPGNGISKKKKSDIIKKAKRGEDMFGHGKNFEKIAKTAEKRYGSEEAGKRIAGAIFWKKVKGKHMTKEDVDDLLWIIDNDLEIILDNNLEK